ncbi:hypothetical protein Hanom_Chr07g00624701 [Helianthus anomalus]
MVCLCLEDLKDEVSMRYFHSLRNKFWSMVLPYVKEKSSTNKVPVIDVTWLGYFKVLGMGTVSAS